MYYLTNSNGKTIFRSTNRTTLETKLATMKLRSIDNAVGCSITDIKPTPIKDSITFNGLLSY